jgi:hypothetical protein
MNIAAIVFTACKHVGYMIIGEMIIEKDSESDRVLEFGGATQKISRETDSGTHDWDNEVHMYFTLSSTIKEACNRF